MGKIFMEKGSFGRHFLVILNFKCLIAIGNPEETGNFSATNLEKAKNQGNGVKKKPIH
jgi:hypothetical protein